jgi:hypothetical protein
MNVITSNVCSDVGEYDDDMNGWELPPYVPDIIASHVSDTVSFLLDDNSRSYNCIIK